MIFGFLSTLSLRRATMIHPHLCDVKLNFYPRSPCGERPDTRRTVCNVISISIHALLAESDAVCVAVQSPASRFLSTLSLRRATNTSIAGRITSNDFYPRSPCGERQICRAMPQSYGYFYPRSPCGERLRQNYECFEWIKFLSTLSLRRATSLLCYMIHLV